VDIFVARPREPEKTDREDERAYNHGRETFFWDEFSVFSYLACKAGLCNVGTCSSADDHTDEDRKEW